MLSPVQILSIYDLLGSFCTGVPSLPAVFLSGCFRTTGHVEIYMAANDCP